MNTSAGAVSNDIIVIADTQVKPTSSVKHLEALAKYIWKHKPAVIVHIGDNWDFESLSSYSSGLKKEGLRLIDDIKAGEDALAIIPNYINQKNLSGKRKKYKPQFHFIMGNHENRLSRMISDNPHLLGVFDLKGDIEKSGWKVHDFLFPFWYEGIAFNHYMPNPLSGRPIGGSIENKLNKHPHSFVHGHVQQYQFGRRPNLEGKPHFGVCAGSFYFEDEGYRGACNTELRGFTHLKSFVNRYKFNDFDVDFVSIERLLEMYK